MVITEFQQFQEINNLMVSPIADIRPRVLRLNHFPVDAFIGNPIGVIAVRRSGVQEFGNDMIDKKRITERERFPVLEDIPPVALISYHRLSFFVLHANREEVPRP